MNAKKIINQKLFAERLSELLENSDETTYSIAKKLSLSAATISRYANGKMSAKIPTVISIADIFNVNEAWLMGYDVSKDRIQPTTQRKRHLIPVLGYVRAGIPIEAVEEILDYEEIDEKTASNGEYFGLRINGNSMYPELKENDVVIVRKQSSADTGNIVIALINGDDACCKKLIKHDNGIVLQSINPAYEPMFFSNEDIQTKPVSIIGKVIEHRRKY